MTPGAGPPLDPLGPVPIGPRLTPLPVPTGSFRTRASAGLYSLRRASYLTLMSLAANLSALIACSLVAVSPAAAAQEQLPSSGSEAGDRGTDDRQAKAGADAAADDGAGNVVPGEILVKFEEGVSPERIETINRRLGATVVNRMLEGRLVLVTIPYPSATSQLIDAYAATEGVEYAEPNQEVSLYPPPENVGTAPSPPESGNRGGGLPPPNEDGSAPLIPLPGPR